MVWTGRHIQGTPSGGGGATFAFHIGGDRDLIQYLGDWTSDAYQRYEEMSTSRRLELPAAMAKAIANGILSHT